MKTRVLVILMICFCLTLPVASDQKEEKKSVEKVQVPTVKEIKGFWYGYKDYTGPYSTMKEKVMAFVQEFMGQGLIPMGNAVSTYYNSPEKAKPEELKWAFGFMVTKETIIKEPILKKEIKIQKAVVLLHKGPYEKLGESYKIAWKFAKEKKLNVEFPVYDRYLNNPQMVKPEELETLIILPLK